MRALMEGEIMNLVRVWSTVIASLCYCRFVSARLRKGKWRLVSLAPVLYAFAVLPMYTASAFFTAVTAFFITWLATFKLILFAFERGPVASGPSKSLPGFIAIAALPFTIKPENSTPKRPKKLPLYLATEIPISLALLSILHDYRDRVHVNIVLVAYCCLLFLMIEILVELSCLTARATLGLELEPASDEPYLSTSLREFWGRRWNLTVTGLLREAVYKPVRVAVGGDLGALLGVLAAFLVSGLMHEVIFWYVNRVRPSWEMTMFFVVQGVGMVVETVVLARRKWRLPWLVSGPLTVGFVAVTGFWLFFPPLMRNGADVRVIGEFRVAGEIVKEKVMEVWPNVRETVMMMTHTLV